MKWRCGTCRKWFALGPRQERRMERGESKFFACSRECTKQLCAIARKTNSGGRPNQGKTPVKDLARVHVYYALITGRLKRPKRCSRCGKNPGRKANGNPKVEAHHEDHGKPLDVTWLCVDCHEKITTPTRIRGEKIALAKLDREKVIAIREQRLAGAKVVFLARQHSVHVTTIQRVINKQGWRHV